MTVSPVLNTQVSFEPSLFPKAAWLFHAAHSGAYRVIVCGGAIRGGKSYGVGGMLYYMYQQWKKHRGRLGE